MTRTKNLNIKLSEYSLVSLRDENKTFLKSNAQTYDKNLLLKSPGKKHAIAAPTK